MCMYGRKAIHVLLWLLSLSMVVIMLSTNGCGRPKTGQLNPINSKVDQIAIGKATRADMVEVFGEPSGEVGQSLIFADGLQAYMPRGVVEEIRFESSEAGYRFRGQIGVGSPLDDVLAVLGQPDETVVGKNEFKDGILYKDIDGRTGWCYYARKNQGVRLFFSDYRIQAIYLTASNGNAQASVQREQPPQPRVATQPRGQSSINDKVDQITIGKSRRVDMVEVFGKPSGEVGQCLMFSGGLQAYMPHGVVEEIRFESPEAGYRFRGQIGVGSPLADVFAVLGQPDETIVGKNEFKNGVFYKDINGRTGWCFYARQEQGVRLFFLDYKVSALYLTPNTDGQRAADLTSNRQGTFNVPVTRIDRVALFDDVRWKDMTFLDLSQAADLLPTLTFNEATVWPGESQLPANFKAVRLLHRAMDPGLGVWEIHSQEITGKGVNVGIIDQPLYADHPEFLDKIAAYHDVGCGLRSSMHGPAVASLLVGEKCGTAPGARVYYAAAPSWNKDAKYQAQALDWLVAENAGLPAESKIRVISVSGAPSGHGSPFTQNNAMWDEACRRAESAGIVVLDCTSHRGFIGPCRLDSESVDSVAACTPGFPGGSNTARPNTLLVPTCPRTTAEQYNADEFSYQYCGRGGLSWAIPYAAGVMACGWQVRPDIPGQRMVQLLFESAHVRKDGCRIINPVAFIEHVRREGVARA